MKIRQSSLRCAVVFLSFAVALLIFKSSVFALPGDLDSSFGANGFVINNLGYPVNGGATGQSVVVQPDGKILVAGRRMVTIGKPIPKSYVARFNADGTLDTTFGTNGLILEDVGIFNGIAALTVQPDGKIVAGGNVTGFTMTGAAIIKFFVVRYNPNGTRDASFLGGGTATTQFSQRATLVSVLLQPDGKIVAAGYASDGQQPNTAIFVAARYNADGSADSSFDGDGKVETSFPNLGGYAWRAVLQPDGKIIIAGAFYEGATFETVKRSIALVRYNPTGALDTTFGIGGIVNTAFAEDSGLTAIALQADGKIVGAGYRVINTNYDFAVVRYDSTGTLDASFGTNGIVTTNFSDVNSDIAQAILIQRNGKIIAVGKSGASDANIALARYNQNGALDATFGQGGKIISSVAQTANQVRAAALQPDGKIVVSGDGQNNGLFNLILARYTGDAAVRPAFDFDGDGKTDISVFRDGVWHLQRSQFGFSAVNWGVASDKLAPADFDGDGITDLTVYRPSNGEWSVLRSSDHAISIVRFGAPEDLPRPADYDGDGKADICVWRPSNGVWYRLNSSNGQFAATAFGQAGDVPLIADFDGDGRADIAVFRPSNGVWYWTRSSDNQFAAVAFGANGDKPVAADYDGDGKTDVAVFRPSNSVWYLNRSAQGFTGIAFGAADDLPVAADYDGDGKIDIAVFRPSNGVWYLQQSTAGFTGVAFGASGDKPIPNAYVP